MAVSLNLTLMIIKTLINAVLVCRYLEVLKKGWTIVLIRLKEHLEDLRKFMNHFKAPRSIISKIYQSKTVENHQKLPIRFGSN